MGHVLGAVHVPVFHGRLLARGPQACPRCGEDRVSRRTSGAAREILSRGRSIFAKTFPGSRMGACLWPGMAYAWNCVGQARFSSLRARTRIAMAANPALRRRRNAGQCGRSVRDGHGPLPAARKVQGLHRTPATPSGVAGFYLHPCEGAGAANLCARSLPRWRTGFALRGRIGPAVSAARPGWRRGSPPRRWPRPCRRGPGRRSKRCRTVCRCRPRSRPGGSSRSPSGWCSRRGCCRR